MPARAGQNEACRASNGAFHAAVSSIENENVNLFA